MKIIFKSAVVSVALTFLAMFVGGLFVHSSDFMTYLAILIAPGVMVESVWPGLIHSGYFLPIVIFIEFVICLIIGFLWSWGKKKKSEE